MKALRLRCHGRLVPAGAQTVLLLDDQADPLYLRFAVLTANLEQQILPALLLDDWGHEMKSLEIYSWMRENGLRFPRAELFGFDPAGQEVQYFLRDLDLMARYPCYAYPSGDTPLAAGRLVAGVCLTDPAGDDPRRIERPAGIELPLRQAQVSWWQANPARLSGFHF